MKISRNWLQNFFEASLPDARVLADALTFHAFEIDGIEEKTGDSVLDVKVTANRGHDCLSHRGIAKELSTILKIPLSVEKDPFARVPDLSKKTGVINISIEDPMLCRRYIAGYMRGVKVGPSPAWLARSLEAIGQRSVNNVVDATNFVMFNTGQPLHAFDAAQLKAENGRYAIAVRSAVEGEVMHALDDREYRLSPTNLVIADGNAGCAIGIAGVKGGKPAGVTETTTDIVIESANFEGVSTRKTAQMLRLRTDASTRFEQVISPELAGYGMKQVVELITAITGGEIAGFVDEYPSPISPLPVSVSVQQVSDCLGISISTPQIEEVLSRLGFVFEKNGDTFTVTPPFERLDILTPEDLIEEVGRIIGYDAVPEVELSPMPKIIAVNKNFYYTEKVREFLVSRGFSEVYTSVFADTGERAVLNKVGGERPFLRVSLVPGLLDVLERNRNLKEVAGLSRVCLFEIGTVWREGSERLVLGIAAEPLKKQSGALDALEELLVSLGATLSGLDSAESVIEIDLDAVFEKLPEPSDYEELPLSETECYVPYSKYPYIVRDISLWVPAETQDNEVFAVIRAAGGGLLVRADRFDRFEKEDRVSLAFRLVFQSFEKTLTDEEVSAPMDALYAALRAKGYEIR